MDEVLLTRARAGDAAAMERLLTEVAPAVHRFGLRMCRHPNDADDVLQDTLIAVANNLASFEGRSSLQSWVFTLARTACSRRRRGLKNRPHRPEDEAPELADDKESPEDQLLRRDMTARVNAALDGLPQQFREVIELRDVQGLSAKEAAEHLGLTVEALKSRLHRGRSLLREALATNVERGRADCPDVVAAFSKKIEGDLSNADCAVIEKHVNGCPSCKAKCDALREALALCKATTEGPVPPAVQHRVREAVRSWADAHEAAISSSRARPVAPDQADRPR
jgi:RNA polymerase sigma-70 factor (ECF subfamily)